MNTALVLLGSNVDTEKNISVANEILALSFGIEKSSSLEFSMPVGDQYKSPFANKAVKLTTHLTQKETVELFKSIETKMGRTAESKINGIIPIDIDLIFWNDNLEHDDYHKFDFIKKCIDQLI